MAEMVERVARAIFFADHPGSDPAVLATAWAITPSWNPRPKYCGIARAAIQAMREPTRAMAEAARYAQPMYDDPPTTGEDYWATMIDAALAE